MLSTWSPIEFSESAPITVYMILLSDVLVIARQAEDTGAFATLKFTFDRLVDVEHITLLDQDSTASFESPSEVPLPIDTTDCITEDNNDGECEESPRRQEDDTVLKIQVPKGGSSISHISGNKRKGKSVDCETWKLTFQTVETRKLWQEKLKRAKADFDAAIMSRSPRPFSLA